MGGGLFCNPPPPPTPPHHGSGLFCNSPVVVGFFATPAPPQLLPIMKRVKVKGDLEARDNQFLFENAQNNEIFEIFKMLN